MRKLRIGLWAAVVIAAFLFGLFAYQLSQPKNDFVQSAMVGEQVPGFALPPMVGSRPGLASADLADGRPKLLNIFASWCIPCRVEAPQLEALERQGAQIVAVAIRDRPEDVDRFLAEFGNPFTRIGSDTIGEVQIALGSSGVPETFVIDGAGRITYQHIGDIREEHVPLLLEELRKAGG
ncbi:MAG: DsbE family thiol:disulfide interchange protein [Alteraurantiacibacter sp.]